MPGWSTRVRQSSPAESLHWAALSLDRRPTPALARKVLYPEIALPLPVRRPLASPQGNVVRRVTKQVDFGPTSPFVNPSDSPDHPSPTRLMLLSRLMRRGFGKMQCNISVQVWCIHRGSRPGEDSPLLGPARPSGFSLRIVGLSRGVPLRRPRPHLLCPPVRGG